MPALLGYLNTLVNASTSTSARDALPSTLGFRHLCVDPIIPSFVVQHRQLAAAMVQAEEQAAAMVSIELEEQAAEEAEEEQAADAEAVTEVVVEGAEATI